jgi:hypothetical protein
MPGGVTLGTMMEIFTNPSDIVVLIHQSEDRFGVIFSRGKGHKYKQLLSSQPDFNSVEAAVDSVKGVFAMILEECEREIMDPLGFYGSLLNPNVLPTADLPVLSQAMVDSILVDLRQTQYVDTSSWQTIPADKLN